MLSQKVILQGHCGLCWLFRMIPHKNIPLETWHHLHVLFHLIRPDMAKNYYNTPLPAAVMQHQTAHTHPFSECNCDLYTSLFLLSVRQLHFIGSQWPTTPLQLPLCQKTIDQSGLRLYTVVITKHNKQFFWIWCFFIIFYWSKDQTM